MDNRGLERIIIVILLLLDVFLLSTVLSDRAESRRNDSETVARLTEQLANNGITAEPGAIPVRDAPPALKLIRSMQRETDIVQTAFGKTTQEDLGGNIYYYRAEGGQAVFRGSGEIVALFSPGTVPERSGTEKTVRRLMRRIGVGIEVISDGIDETGNPYTQVILCQNGYPVFNAELQFDFSDNGLYMVSGTRQFDTLVQTEETERMNSVSALMRFMESVSREGIICSKLTECRPGYLLSVVVSGESTLTPVWWINTDVATYIINAETGKLETVAS